MTKFKRILTGLINGIISIGSGIAAGVGLWLFITIVTGAFGVWWAVAFGIIGAVMLSLCIAQEVSDNRDENAE